MPMDDKPSNNNSIAFDRHNNTIYFHPQLKPSIKISTSIEHVNRTSTMVASHNKMAVGNLMSPPESQLIQSFDQKLTSPTMAQNKPKFAAQQPFLSPPISPANIHIRPDAPRHINGAVNDPILYPQSDASSTSQPPLFMPASTTIEEDVVARFNQNIMSDRARRKLTTKQQMAPPPTKEEFLIAIDFKTCMMKSVYANPNRWRNRERGLLQDQQRARNAAAAKKSFSHATTTPKKAYPVLAPSPSGVQKARSPQKPPARTPKPRRERASATPDIGSGRSRNTGTSTREDKDFIALPDKCPPLSSIDDWIKAHPGKVALSTDWKGTVLDLSNDPNRDKLHPAELVLASKLRLDCATYLTSKRRIFQARYECFKGTWGAAKGKKEFRKTDAQQACKIDVNKASKLWQAFHDVAWFEEKWIRSFSD